MPRLQFPALELERCPLECIIHLQLPEWGPCLFEAVVFFMPGHQIEPTTGHQWSNLCRRIMKMNQVLSVMQCTTGCTVSMPHWSPENVSVSLHIWVFFRLGAAKLAPWPCCEHLHLQRPKTAAFVMKKVPWQEGVYWICPTTLPVVP